MTKTENNSDSENELKDHSALGYGYESDSEAKLTDDSDHSSDEDQEEASKENSEDSKGNDGDDDDMFLSDTEKEKTLKKGSKGFDLMQFEQETETTGYTISTDYQELKDESEEYVPIEEFSIRKEAATGVFDKDGVPKKNESDEEEEPWMEGLEKDDIKKARKAKERQNQIKEKSEIAVPRESLIEQLVGLLEAAETPFDALHRLRPPKIRKRKAQAVPANDEERKAKVCQITEACETLANTYGVSQIYELSREQLLRAYKQITGKDLISRGTKRSADEAEIGVNGSTNESVVQDEDQKIWMFRWIGEIEINGPYTTYEMEYWKNNYFENNVEVCKHDREEFTHISEVNFDT